MPNWIAPYAFICLNTCDKRYCLVKRLWSFKKKKIRDLLKDYNLDSVRIKTGVADLCISRKTADKDAAWDLYVEMLTRIVTQKLPSEQGDEKAALDSVYSLFPTTRNILCRHGRKTVEFTSIAVLILNQVVRPFTTKWHRENQMGAFDYEEKRIEFRTDLCALLTKLRSYTRMLAELADVKDLTDLESKLNKFR